MLPQNQQDLFDKLGLAGLLGTLRMDNENADVNVDQRKARATHAHYCQPRFRHVLLPRAEREDLGFDVVVDVEGPSEVCWTNVMVNALLA